MGEEQKEDTKVRRTEEKNRVGSDPDFTGTHLYTQVGTTSTQFADAAVSDSFAFFSSFKRTLHLCCEANPDTGTLVRPGRNNLDSIFG